MNEEKEIFVEESETLTEEIASSAQNIPIVSDDFIKPTKREVLKMIFGAYIGMLPLLITFIIIMIVVFLILLAWGG